MHFFQIAPLQFLQALPKLPVDALKNIESS